MKTKQVRAEYIGLQLALIDLETIAGQIEGFCIQTRNLHTNMYLYFTNENIHLKLTLLQLHFILLKCNKINIKSSVFLTAVQHNSFISITFETSKCNKPSNVIRKSLLWY